MRPLSLRRLFLLPAALVLCCLPVTAANLPDLTISAYVINPFLVTQTFASNSCEVVEGCATPGTRRLLKFDTQTQNIGPGDLYLGSPVNNPLFRFNPCHGHYHFEQFAIYRLLNSAGALVTTAYKAGFCLGDGAQILPNANPNPIYENCNVQGIQSGWADIYGGAQTPCQWIDITAVHPGLYTLEMEIDPAHLLSETDESNNITRLAVAIDAPCAVAPANDAFSAAQLITGSTAFILGGNGCATNDPGEPHHAGNIGGHSVWYRWTAPANGPTVITTQGSTFDTLLAVYHGSALNSLALDAQDDDSGGNRTSRVTFNAVAGVEYHVVVDGRSGTAIGTIGGATGGFLLTLNPNLLTPPHFDAITGGSGSGVQLTLTGIAGFHYEIHSATALGAWTPLQQVTNLTGTFQFTDLTATNFTQRFYRAVLLP
ncbi:MAG TPA: lysyl oxidase family protein [Verrucomicrobiae bacterium]|jgi:hypothetical protein